MINESLSLKETGGWKIKQEEKEETKGSRRQRKSRKIQEKNGPRIVQHRAETME